MFLSLSPYGVPGQEWYSIVLIPDLGLLPLYKQEGLSGPESLTCTIYTSHISICDPKGGTFLAQVALFEQTWWWSTSGCCIPNITVLVLVISYMEN